MFSKNIRTIYLYVICLITLFMVIGGILGSIFATAELIFPTNYNYYSYDYEYSSSEMDVKYNGVDTIQRQTQEEKNRFNEGIRDILYSISVAVVALPVYLFTWNTIEKDRKNLKVEETESAGE